MMNKIELYFSRFKQTRFMAGSILLLFVMDLINSFYLQIYWNHKNLSLNYVHKLAESQGLEFSDLSESSILEIKNLVDQSFYLFLFIILINNIVFYFFTVRKKIWAQGYVIFYAVTNALLSFVFLIEGPILGYYWLIYNLCTSFIYLYLYLGMRFHKFKANHLLDQVASTEEKKEL